MTRSTPVFRVIFIVFSLLAAHLLCPPFSRAAREVTQPVFHEFPMPESLTLCDEPVPLGNRWVWELLDRELTISAWDRAQVFMWLKRAGRYFPHIEKELAKAGMPEDLKYLAVAESSLLTHIRSKKGAMGPWQFMAHTARINGLRKDRRMDERRDFERSTGAALRYLKGLKETFGTWTLALAAYNCGGARLKEEIREQKVRDYYRLNLPSETERFIFRIAAIKVIMENPETYGYLIRQERVYRPIPCDTVPVKIGVPLHLTDLALAAGTDLKVLKDLNPQILGYYLPKGRYRIKTPAGLGSKTAKAIKKLSRTASVPAGKVSGRYYVVEPGDTLSGISKKTGVSVTTLRRLNGIEGSLIMVDQKLRLRP
jgi:membrane-bound lytic murein transglycosylase D